jgi:hypothetical protein
LFGSIFCELSTVNKLYIVYMYSIVKGSLAELVRWSE